MKRRLIYIGTLVVMAMMLVVSCSKGGDEPTPPTPPTPPIVIPTESTSLSFEGGETEQEVEFTATTDWNVTLEETTRAIPDWVRVSPVSGGAGDVTLEIEADENTTEKERSSNVIIKAGGEPYVIAITQKAAKPSSVAVTGVTLNKTTLSLIEGETEPLTATVAPANATNKNVSWKSSDEKVATAANGVVKAIKAGTATITVTTADGSKTEACEVTVHPAIVSVTGVSLNKTTLSLAEGETESLTATITPANATNKNVSWKSSDTAVVTVDATGKVVAVKAGTATITVTAEDGSKSETCAVKVQLDSAGGTVPGIAGGEL